MKLSEVLRLGAMAVPPVHGPYFQRDGDGRICGACAIGTILYASLSEEEIAERGDDTAATDVLFAKWPWTRTHEYLASDIITRFEMYRETREQIADWIATIEPADDPQSPPIEAPKQLQVVR